MNNLSQILTILLSISFCSYLLYNYNPPIKKNINIVNIENSQAFGIHNLFGTLNMDGSNAVQGYDFIDINEMDKIQISGNNELQLIMDMIKSYNKMDANKVSSFFKDSCRFIDLNGQDRIIKHEDFNTFFNSLDSIIWNPISIIPLKLKENKNLVGTTNSTATIIHSYEKRFKKDNTSWTKELIEVFYIKDNKIIRINQFGKGSEYFD